MASKSKKRRRVLGASCILAALIIAGSSFAWFTSKDEVTNRLSANADYDVSIVESYAPPKNFLPGQKVNKDVYATNTGSIGAFVEEKVSTRISVVDEVDTTTTWGKTTVNAVEVDTGVISTNKVGSDNVAVEDCVELTKDEYYAIEAGSYLAYKPYASQYDLGDIIVHYPDASLKAYIKKTDYTDVITEAAYDALTFEAKANYIEVNETMYKKKGDSEKGVITKAEYDLKTDTEKATYVKMSFKDDFTPDANGLYVFRRTIDTMTNGGEFFTYDGYYFQDGKYYKVNNIVVTPDNLIDFTYDGENTDGQLTTATANLVYEKKEIVVPTLTYDAAKNRLVATYERGYNATTLMTTLEGKAKALDQAEHNLAVARAQLQKALQDSAASDANVAKYTNSVTQLENELEATKARIAELEALIGYEAGSATAATGTGESANQYTAAGTGTVASPKKGIEAQIANETTAQSTAETNAKTALGNLYGNNNSNDDFTRDTYVPNVADITKTIETVTNEDVNSALSAYGNSAYGYEYLKAMNDLRTLKQSGEYGSDMFNAYVNEMKDKFSTVTGIGAVTTFDDLVAFAGLKWDDLDDVVFNNTTAYTAAENQKLHRINELTVEYLKKKEQYDNELAKAKSEIAKYKKATENIGAAAALADDTGKTIKGADGTEIAYYTPKKTAAADTGLMGEQADLKAELATAVAKKAALLKAIDTELTNADNAQTVGDGTTNNQHTAAENLATSKTNYNTAYAAYQKALDEYNNADEAYKQSGDLKIYINLSKDVVTYGGIADKWQMLPTTTVDELDNATMAEYGTGATKDNKGDTAYFYWTGILQGGETTSSMLIDSVELDENTTQDMYKEFDFDIDVSLKSAQVAYDEAGNVLATAANKELDANVAITDPTNEKDTALTWTVKP